MVIEVVMKKTSYFDQHKSYEQYLKSDDWKCPEAEVNPGIALQVKHKTGAHYWIELTVDGRGEYYCRYCYKTRRMK